MGGGSQPVVVEPGEGFEHDLLPEGQRPLLPAGKGGADRVVELGRVDRTGQPGQDPRGDGDLSRVQMPSV